MSERRKIALVTGASYGIGAAAAIELAKGGFDVAVTEIFEADLAPTIAQLEAAGARAAAVGLDYRQTDSIEPAFNQAVDKLGPVDVLVNNAGTPSVRKPAIEVTPDEWQAALQINLTGTFFMSTTMGRHLIDGGRGGSIVNISSTHGLVGYATASVYGATKAGINQLTRTLAIEWASQGIRVNAVAPGPVETKTRAAAHADPVERQFSLGRVPLGRYGEADDIAKAVRYLASDDAAFVTGHILVVDGGVTAQ
jgi:NAD(P)-dependent dehydrogenase (short-subunit alcohol dehydrogenase family)